MAKRTRRLVTGLIAVGVLLVAAGYLLMGRRQRTHSTVATTQTGGREAAEAGPDIRPDFMFPPGSASGSIEGRVVDDKQQPVADAVVSIAPRITGSKGFRDWFKQDAVVTARTNAHGIYKADNIRPGVLAIAVSAPRFFPGRKEPVKLLPDQALTGVDIQLAHGGVRIHGTVSDTGGGPIGGARIVAAGFVTKELGDDGQGGVLLLHGFADEQGRYELYVRPSSYEVRVSASGYAPDEGWVQATQERQHDVKLHPASRISGVVMDKDKRPLARAEVTITKAQSMWMSLPQIVHADDQGRYISQEIDPGRYTIEGRHGPLATRLVEPVHVAVAAQMTVDLVLDRALAISGRVTDANGKGIAGAKVKHGEIWDLDADKEVRFAVTDAEGRYELQGMLGPYVRLKAEAEGRGGVVREETNVKEDRKGVDFKLNAAASVLIKASGPDGKPLEGAHAFVQVQTEGSRYPIDGVSAERASGADGTVRVGNLPPGKATVYVNTADLGQRQLSDVQLVAGAEKTLTVAFDATGTVEGKVVWDDGTPAAGLIANAFGDKGGAHETTDAQGSFKIKNLPPGKYTVMAFQPNSRVVVFDGKLDANSVANVELAANAAVTGVKIIIRKDKNTIEGLVLNPDGSPAAGAQVGATSNASARFGGCNNAYGGKFLTDESGRFKIEGVASGLYGVCATRAGHPNVFVSDVSAGSKSVRLQLVAPATLSGVVLDGSGKPIAKAMVAATYRQPEEADAAFAPWKSAASSAEVKDASGSFTLTGLSPGIWDVMATTADGKHGLVRHIQLQEGKQVTGISVRIQDGIKLTGRLVHAETNAPVVGATVSAGIVEAQDTTDAAGRFELTNIPAGMKQAVHFEPQEKTVLGDYVETWIPENARTHDIGTIELMGIASDDDHWRSQAGAAACGLRVRHEGGHPVVTGIFEQSPAASSGVKVRDRVLAINGKDISKMGHNAVDVLLSGEVGKTVTVRVQSADGAARDVEMPLAKF